MAFLGQREPHTAADDVEAQGATHNNGEGASSTTRSPRTSGGGSGAAEHIKFGEINLEPPGTGRRSDLGEYEQLDHFITNYDVERRASMATGSGRSHKKPRWWQFWKSSVGEPEAAPQQPAERGKPPEAWLETDIRSGLTRAEVEERRSRFGWNELTAEKENMFQKVLSYFQGPILYGTL